MYGTEPNNFVKSKLLNLKKGKILFPAEGEGRNAVYASKLGFEVVAFDQSEKAKEKALVLAQNENVNLTYLVESFENIHFNDNEFDCIFLVFAHFAKEKRQEYHKKLLNFLKPGGSIILEGFAKEQIQYNTGGPKNVDMLFSENELREDFQLVEITEFSKQRIILNEGELHKGDAEVLRLMGIK